MNTDLETLESRECPFLENFFRNLNQAEIPYAVMRNHEPLPQSSGGSDLDILVRPADVSKTESIVFKSIKMAGGVAIGCSKTVGFFKVYAFGLTDQQPGEWWGQRIDINVGVVFKGIPLLDNEGWRKFTYQYNDLTVLIDELAGVLGVLKEILNNSQMPSRYMVSAKRATSQNWNEIKAVLQPMGETALELLHDLIITGGGDDILRRCRQLRVALTAHAIRRQPLTTLQQRFLALWSKIDRYLAPSGAVIAILGVDGAGKSTVINAIKPVLDAATHNATIVQHLRPGLLPPLARLKGKSNLPTGPVQDPHGSKPSGPLGSILRLSYLSLDYILGYWLLVRPKIAKHPTVVIFDRYAYDIILDPKRFRIKLPTKIIKFFLYFVPQPHLVFCLHGSPETIVNRKKELPLDEVKRQLKALQIFIEKESYFISISTQTDIVTTRKQILFSLKNYLQKR